MKILTVFTAFFLICLTPLFITKAFAAIPSSNQMQLGDISPLLPAQEMSAYFKRMNPVYLEYFGPPFSNINLNIITSPNIQDGGDGFLSTSQTLEYGFLEKGYRLMMKQNPAEARDMLITSMRHELSHGRYLLGNQPVSYENQWINEGWAKLFEFILEQKLEKDTGRITNPIYFYYYLDKEAVAGTGSWGNNKTPVNHSLVYSMTTITHFLLATAGSTSSEFLDFPKKYNEALYDNAVANNTHRLSETDVRKILDNLLPNTYIDGIKATDWYFQSPAAFVNGTLGYHVGVFEDNRNIVAFVLKRGYQNNERNNNNSGDLRDFPIRDISVTIEIVDADGRVILSQIAQTDSTGKASIKEPRLEDNKLYTLKASATLQGEKYQNLSYYYDVPSRDSALSGILTDEFGKAVDKRYVGLLTSDIPIEYKNNGIFFMEVPKDQRTVTLNFLGYSQEITKGSFTRVFFMKVPQSYLDKAAELSEQELAKGLITQSSSLPGLSNDQPLVVTSTVHKFPFEMLLITVGLLFFGALVYLLKKGRLNKSRVLISAALSLILVGYFFNFVPQNVQVIASRSPLRRIADYSLNFIIFFVIIYLLVSYSTYVYKKIRTNQK